MRLNRDVTTGLVLLLFCGAVYYVTTTFRDVPVALSQNVPPTFFPRVVLAAIALLSITLIATSWRKRDAPKTPLDPSVYVTAAIFVLAVGLVPYLGMLGTVFVISIALPLYWGERSPLRIASLALTLPIAVHVLFDVALSMRFPRGVLW